MSTHADSCTLSMFSGQYMQPHLKSPLIHLPLISLWWGTGDSQAGHMKKKAKRHQWSPSDRDPTELFHYLSLQQADMGM